MGKVLAIIKGKKEEFIAGDEREGYGFLDGGMGGLVWISVPLHCDNAGGADVVVTQGLAGKAATVLRSGKEWKVDGLSVDLSIRHERGG